MPLTPGCGGGATAASGSQAMVSWASQTRAVALRAPSDRLTRQMSPAKQSARAITPGPSMQLPFSPRARSSKEKMISGFTGLPGVQPLKSIRANCDS